LAGGKKQGRLPLSCCRWAQFAGTRCPTTYIFSSTMPLAWEAPAKGFFHSLPRWLLL
jgi:hypothetical protein